MSLESIIGVFPPHWRITTLGAACAEGGGEVQTGPFGSQLHASDYVPIGIPSVMPQNIGDNRISSKGIARIRQEDADRLTRYKLRSGDIVYSRRGDVERRALVREEENGWLCGTGCLRVRLGNGPVHPTFAAFYLSHPAVRAWVVQHAIGATMPNLNTSILSSLPILIPPKREQAGIASVLGTLDDKIEMNRQMNETLEVMARAIFKDWFVDFGPVRAKAEGRQPPGLSPDIAALFPDALDDEDKPVGWPLITWGNLASLEYGKRLENYQATGGAYPVFGTNGAIGSHHTALCPEAGIIIGRKGAYRGVHFSNRPFYVIDTAFYLKPKVPCSPRWAYYSICAVDINSMDSGSAIPSTSREDFYALDVIEPPYSIQEKFDEILTPIWKRQAENDAESETLAQLRDLLLPKLMSGEIRIKDAEQTVGAVL